MGEESTRAEADPLGGRGGRRTITQMVVVGLIASVLGIALGLAIDWFPAQGSEAGQEDRHVLGRADHLLGPGVRPRDDRRAVRGRATSGCGPGRSTSTGRRSTATRSSRSSGRRSRRSCSSRCAPTPTSCCTTSRRRRPPATSARSTVNGQQFTWTFDYNEGGKKFTSRPALRARGRVGQVQRQDQGRPARLLGPGVADEDRRGPGHHDALPGHADQARHLPRRLRRALRPRPRVHAPDRARPAQGAVRGLGQEDDGHAAGGAPPRGGRRPAARRRRSTPRRCSRRARRRPARPPAAAATSSPTRARPAASARTSTQVLKGKDAAFIKQSIVDPNAEIAKGFDNDIMPGTYSRLLNAAEIDALVKYLEEVAAK